MVDKVDSHVLCISCAVLCSELRAYACMRSLWRLRSAFSRLWPGCGASLSEAAFACDSCVLARSTHPHSALSDLELHVQLVRHDPSGYARSLSDQILALPACSSE